MPPTPRTPFHHDGTSDRRRPGAKRDLKLAYRESDAVFRGTMTGFIGWCSALVAALAIARPADAATLYVSPAGTAADRVHHPREPLLARGRGRRRRRGRHGGADGRPLQGAAPLARELRNRLGLDHLPRRRLRHPHPRRARRGPDREQPGRRGRLLQDRRIRPLRRDRVARLERRLRQRLGGRRGLDRGLERTPGDSNPAPPIRTGAPGSPSSARRTFTSRIRSPRTTAAAPWPPGPAA